LNPRIPIPSLSPSMGEGEGEGYSTYAFFRCNMHKDKRE
jgi:hypothetical protein